MNEGTRDKDIEWVGSSLDDLRSFPEEVKDDVGYALREAQKGLYPSAAKPLKDFGGRSVLEIISNFCKNTYRAVYTVRFKKAVYVLHCFQKKSTHGRETSKHDIDLIIRRLCVAQEHYKTEYERGQ